MSQNDHRPPSRPNFLHRQLELTRFERALEVAESMVESGAFLNSGELARINNILTGESSEPWRDGLAVCTLPSGRQESFQLLADPVEKTREILRRAKDRAVAGEVVEAAADLYAQLVLTHVFKDANRRTAVVAVAYLLKLHSVEISALGLHELGLGDLRAEGQLEALRETLKNVVKMSVSRGAPKQ
ncbi:MAG: Fic family protein [Bdellovibrionota bacterium]